MSTAEATQRTQTNEKLHTSLSNLIGGIQANPGLANATFRAKSVLESGFLTDIRVRDFHFVSDEPEDLGGTDRGPNPVEYVLGALAACQEIVIKAYATVLDIDVKSVRVDVEGDLDLHGFLSLTDARPGFEKVSFRTRIVTSETDPEKLASLERLAVERCPVLDIIQNPVPVKGTLTFQSE